MKVEEQEKCIERLRVELEVYQDLQRLIQGMRPECVGDYVKFRISEVRELQVKIKRQLSHGLEDAIVKYQAREQELSRERQREIAPQLFKAE